MSSNRDVYAGNPLGYQTEIVNSTLVPVAPKAAYNPLIVGGAFTGPAWPRQGVYNVPPVIPSPEATSEYLGGGGGMRGAAAPSGEGVSPWHWAKSPVLWVLIFLVFSIVMLHKVHYRG